MSKSIWKFPVETTDNQEIRMPAGAKILSIQTQSNSPCICAEVDTNAPKESRFIDIYSTKDTLPNNPGQYLGTYQLNDGMSIFHVYERNPK